jgi:lipopolysaccharide transport system permease protein
MTDLSAAKPGFPLLEITSTPPADFGALEAWRYRELLWFLVWRDVKVRYKQTALGVLWALLQPVGMMVVFSLFLGRFAHVPSNGAPYPLMVLSGLLPWQLFAHGVADSSNSLVANERLITKVYFPRMIVPAAAVGGATVDFAIGLCVVAACLVWYGIRPTSAILLVPALTLLAVAAAFAVGLGLSALNVRYRDVRHSLGFLLQLWMFLTPVVYPASVVPERWRPLYAINPMAGIVEGFRWSLLQATPFPARELTMSMVSIAVLLIAGVVYFRRMEGSFADTI